MGAVRHEFETDRHYIQRQMSHTANQQEYVMNNWISLVASALLCAPGVGFGQATTPAPPANSPVPAAQSKPKPVGGAEHSTHEVRPDAVYPKPSGQDSQPRKSNTITRRDVPASRASSQPSAAPAASKQTYQGQTGRKSAPSTACSTARTKADGTLDCGTGGNAALPGRIPK